MNTFSPAAYHELLRGLLAQARPFVLFRDAPDAGLLLRHDVDYSPEWAAELAQVNADLGVRGTFFFLTDSPLYNLFAASSRAALEQVAALGQDVGLHVRCAPLEPSAEALRNHFAVLRLAAPESIPVLAWHNPPTELAPLNRIADSAGFQSAYAPRWFAPGRYLSDSNLRHSPEGLLQATRECPSPILQVLLHPFNWIDTSSTIEDILARTCAHRIRHVLAAMHENRYWNDRLAEHPLRAPKPAVPSEESPHDGQS